MSDISVLMARYQSVICESLGYTCEQHGSDLVFEWNGVAVVVHDHSNDPAYLELYVAFPVADFAVDDVLCAANSTNRSCKGISAFTVPGTAILAARAVVSAPGVLPERAHLVAVLPRSLSMLGTAIAHFAQELTLAGIAEASVDVDPAP